MQIKRQNEKESDIQRTILEYLDVIGVFNTRVNSGMIATGFGGKTRMVKGAKAGFPDILVLYKGRFIGLEVKTQKGKQNDNQIIMEREIKKNGGEYYVVRSIVDVDKALLG